MVTGVYSLTRSITAIGHCGSKSKQMEICEITRILLKRAMDSRIIKLYFHFQQRTDNCNLFVSVSVSVSLSVAFKKN